LKRNSWENEPVILKIRSHMHKCVIFFRKGMNDKAVSLYSRLVNIDLKNIISFIENSSYIRSINIQDTILQISQLRRQLIYAGLGIVTFVLIFSFLLSTRASRAISKPIKKLIKATELIAGGDLTQRIDIKSGDEIGVLGRSFNKMTEDLRNPIKKTKEFAVAAADFEKKRAEELNTHNQQLSASEQQLKVNEQHLKTSNQQLSSSEQQLKASMRDPNRDTHNERGTLTH